MSLIEYDQVRSEAARSANQEDASLWRWFCTAYEEGRIRWCRSGERWFVSVDHKHLATEPDFDMAIRAAHTRYFSGCRLQRDGKR